MNFLRWGAAQQQPQQRQSLVRSKCQVLDALLQGNRSLARDLVVDDGLDPFYAPLHIAHFGGKTAFHEASSLGDLELMLAMVAEPGSEWSERYFFSQQKVMRAPVQGRTSIPSLAGRRGSGFCEPGKGLSMEGLEVMIMYGYKIKDGDLETICTSKNCELLKFVLASVLDKSTELGYCFGRVCQFQDDRGEDPYEYQLIFEFMTVLLKAGADPNGESFRNPHPDVSMPHLYVALRNRNVTAMQLLMAFRADAEKNFHIPGMIDNPQAVMTWAEEMGLSQYLIALSEIITANPESYRQELRHEFERPLKNQIKARSRTLVVAMMRSTGLPPPLGLVTRLILQYMPLGHALWKLDESI